MVRIFVRHSVEDYQAWRKAYDAFDEQRRAMGVSGDAVFQSVENPNDVTVWHDFDTAEAARAFATSNELRNAMQDGGVQGQPQVWFVSPS
jgi:heme-degrading monooxygenase HmoA